MNKKNRTPTTMVSTKSKHKVSCSTPEQRPMSPSSDSMGDSEAASPVPFLCTQDGTEGDTDVVWNFYTPKSDNASSRLKNSTPLSRKHRKPIKKNIIDSPLPKRRPVRATQLKPAEMFQELIELNQNLQELIAKKKKSTPTDKCHSGSEEDIFNESGESPGSPKSGLKTNSRCLRRNVLSSKFSKPDPDMALESDDSINECLIKASQIVEEKFLDLNPLPLKRSRLDNHLKETKKDYYNHKIDNDSMDAILNNIKLDSPIVKKVKKYDSPSLKNDSFDSLVGNLNDSALERLTQMPINETSKRKLNTSSTGWNVQEVIMSPKSFFSRHNSMPESPVTETKPSTSGMVFGRYNSMPMKNEEKNTDDSPIRCTPEEIKKKHMLAREKLIAKRQLPFTSSQASQLTQSVQAPKNIQLPPKKTSFQPRVASSKNMPRVASCNNIPTNPPNVEHALQRSNSNVDLKLLIEKKRQEALMKLRRRQPRN